MTKFKTTKLFAMLSVLALILALFTMFAVSAKYDEAVGDVQRETEADVFLFCPAHYTQLVRESGYINDFGYVSKYSCPTPGCNYYVWVQE